MIPTYLNSACIDRFDVCHNPLCHHAVKQAPSGRYYITMGHAGFNTKANNLLGYATEIMARKVIRKYLTPVGVVKVSDARSNLTVKISVQ